MILNVINNGKHMELIKNKNNVFMTPIIVITDGERKYIYNFKSAINIMIKRNKFKNNTYIKPYEFMIVME